MQQLIPQRVRWSHSFALARTVLLVLVFGFGWNFARGYPVQAEGLADLEYVGSPTSSVQSVQSTLLAEEGSGEDCPAPAKGKGCGDRDGDCGDSESVADDGCDDPDDGCDDSESLNDDCDDPDDDELSMQRARVVAMPAEGGLIGTWTIGDTDFLTTLDTDFDPRFGAFGDDVCVMVHYTPGTPNVVHRLRTMRGVVCDAGKGQGGTANLPNRNKFFGVVNIIPDGLIGTWTIGSMEFETNESTEFKSPSTPFEQGVTVKVDFETNAAGVNNASRIQTLFKKDNGDDDDRNGFFDGAEGKAYGPINSFPDGLVGPWIIGGIDFMAVDETKFDQDEEEFADGIWVKVEYFVNSSGERIAKEIETTDDDGDVGDDSHFKLIGFVDESPATGFLGDWLIANVLFVFDENSIPEEEHGLLGDGAYVEVEYEVVDGANVIRKIETRVPPGAGDKNHYGVIESIGMLPEGASAEAVSASVWRIDGEEYIVAPSTQLAERSSSLNVGETAYVNSFVDQNGNQVATRVIGISLDVFMFIPAIGR